MCVVFFVSDVDFVQQADLMSVSGYVVDERLSWSHC